MDEARYRQDQAAKRVFGPSARISGTIGSARGPGVLEIRIDDRTIGRGQSFSAALADVTVRRGPERKTAGRG